MVCKRRQRLDRALRAAREYVDAEGAVERYLLFQVYDIAVGHAGDSGRKQDAAGAQGGGLGIA